MSINGAPAVTYTISGQVGQSSNALGGVMMTLAVGSVSSGVAMTDGSGNYSFSVVAGGSYTVTPSLAGYTFSPSSQRFDNVSGNESANFRASALPNGGPSINPGDVLNAASYASAGLAPGSIAAAYGNFLLNSSALAGGLPLPISLSGLSLQFGGNLAAPLYYVSGAQVNLQVPWELAGQSQTMLAAILSSEAGAPQTVALVAFSPGIFSVNSQGTGQGAILDPSYKLVDASNPATAGTVILIYCTGLGTVTNQPPTGSPGPANPLARTMTTPTVTIGGATANVLFSGLAPGYVGLYQVNAAVPAASATGPAVPVVISAGGVESNTVTIAVQ